MSSVNAPQALNAVLAAAPGLSACMLPGIPLPYVLPPATASVLGGVKIGANVSVTPDGTISVAAPTSQTPWTSDIDCAGHRLTAATGVAISFVQAGTVRMSVNAGGYVSIGKTFASYPLDVAGNINCSLGYLLNGSPLAASNVANAVDSSQSYANPSWLTAVPWSILSGSPSSAQIGAIQTPWLQSINGGGFNLTNVIALGVNTTSAILTLDVKVAANQHVGFNQNTSLPAIHAFNDAAGFIPLSISPGANAYLALNAGNVGVGSSLATAPMASPGKYVQVGSDTGTTLGRVMVCSNQPATASIIGEVSFVNFANAAAEKRVAYIQALSANTSGNASHLAFFTSNAAAPVECLRILNTGNVGIGTTAPTSKLQVVGLPTYASDSAAGTGGLTSGAFYIDASGGVHCKL